MQKTDIIMNRYLTIIVLLLLSSCCKDGVEINRYLLSNAEEQFVPYNNDETIAFIHSNGFEFDVAVSNRNTKLERTETEHCGDSYLTYESLTVELHSITPELNIKLKMVPNEYGYDGRMTVSINRSYFNLNIASEPDIDTLTINGKTYNNIYLGESFVTDSLPILPREVFYNKEYGIIQIGMTNADKFTIKD